MKKCSVTVDPKSVVCYNSSPILQRLRFQNRLQINASIDVTIKEGTDAQTNWLYILRKIRPIASMKRFNLQKQNVVTFTLPITAQTWLPPKCASRQPHFTVIKLQADGC